MQGTIKTIGVVSANLCRCMYLILFVTHTVSRGELKRQNYPSDINIVLGLDHRVVREQKNCDNPQTTLNVYTRMAESRMILL